MKLVRTTRSFPHALVEDGSVVTIGSFDGVHLGHRQLLDHVLDKAREHRLPSVVMSFEPTPKEFFAGNKPPARLMKFREKFEALAALGVDVFYCPRFDEDMRNIDAASFIRRLLAHTLNANHLIVGDDFRFARGREGGIEHLERAGAALGLTLRQVESVIVENERVSSTAIRDALSRGDLDKAAGFLGRPYRMSGRVVHGQTLGRRLGYPTANVNLQRRKSAVMGIFAVRVHGLGEQARDAVASVGTRPTFAGVAPLLEVHLFDFDEDIYGRYIHVDFVKKLRSEEKFADADELIAQMHIDSQQARDALAADRRNHRQDQSEGP